MNVRESSESFAALFENAGGGKSVTSKRLRRGESVDVKEMGIGKDAVFVDVGGRQEGTIDRIELLSDKGDLMVEVGSSVNCVVTETGDRIKLSPSFVRKKSEHGTIEDEGETVMVPRASGGPLLVEGATVRGTVTGAERYGVFMQIEGTHGGKGRGLIPTAETATPRGADLRKLFATGSPIEAKIIKIEEDGKIRLSIKALGEDAERKQYEEYAGAESGTPKDEKQKGGGERIRGFGTLGDLLSKAQKKTK